MLLIGLTIKKEAVRTASGKEDATEALIGAFKGGDGFLDSLHIARDAKVEVVNGVAPNIPLLLLDRVGYSIMDVSKKSLDEALTWDFDYFVMQKDDFLNRLIRLSPTLPTHLEGVGVNKKLIVCKVVKQATTDQFMRFIGLPPYIHSSCLFDTSTTLSPNWSNLHSGENEFGITYKEGNLPYFYKQGLKLFCTFDLRADRLKDCFLVVCVKSGDKTVSYQNFDLKKFFVADSHWQEKQFIIDVPQSTYAMNNFELYIWNKGKNAFEIRNFTFTLY